MEPCKDQLVSEYSINVSIPTSSCLADSSGADVVVTSQQNEDHFTLSVFPISAFKINENKTVFVMFYPVGVSTV